MCLILFTLVVKAIGVSGGFKQPHTFLDVQLGLFQLAVGNIGEVYKIRIAHDNSGEFPGWFVDEVSSVLVQGKTQQSESTNISICILITDSVGYHL